MASIVERASLEKLREALNGALNSLRRDECDNWRLKGSRGHIYSDGDGWVLFVACRSSRHWTSTKKRLAFCRITQDGDDEGCLRLDRLPTEAEADEIRHVTGLRQTHEAPQSAFGRDENGTLGLFRPVQPGDRS
jgi:hypothetical protein